jgi:DNA-binding transcriptional LysR family regulator
MIRHLPFFLAAAEEQNFQRAARRLHIAPSALSRRIQDLEYELGDIRLFVRLPRGVRLTAAGKSLQESATRIMAEAQAAEAALRAIVSGESQVVRIGYSIGAIRSRFTSNLLHAFRALNPAVHIDAVLLPVDELSDMLRSGDLDAALFFSEALEADLAGIEIAREDYMLALPPGHRLHGVERVRFDDIRHEELIWYPRAYSLSLDRRLRDAFLARGAEPRIALESPSADVTLRLVEQGMGLGFVPVRLVDSAPPSLSFATIEDLRLDATFHFAWAKGAAGPTIDKLREACARAQAVRLSGRVE